MVSRDYEGDCLRYEKPPYDMYIQLKNDVLEAMPGCVNNPYIKTSMKEFYQLLVELLKSVICIWQCCYFLKNGENHDR